MTQSIKRIPPSHKDRVVTGLSLFALLVLTLSATIWTNIPLLIVVILATGIALWEFYGMFWPEFSKIPEKTLGIIASSCILTASMFNQPWLVMGVLIACFFVCSLSFLFRYGFADNSHRPGTYYIVLAGLIYLPLTLQVVFHLPISLLLIALATALSSDIAAYYAGCLFGTRKIWASVSPKKTWTGSVAGLLAAIVITMVICIIVNPVDIFTQLPYYLGLGCTLGLASQLGDFFESALKRQLGVKDSSSLLPGHGGLLDRIDSLLFTLPTIAVYNYFFNII